MKSLVFLIHWFRGKKTANKTGENVKTQIKGAKESHS